MDRWHEYFQNLLKHINTSNNLDHESSNEDEDRENENNEENITRDKLVDAMEISCSSWKLDKIIGDMPTGMERAESTS